MSTDDTRRAAHRGLIGALAQRARIDAAAVDRVLARRPAPAFERSGHRGGEGFDSVSWPVAWDAAIAFAAACALAPQLPRLAAVISDVAPLRGVPARLRALGRALQLRQFAADGATAAQVEQLLGELSARERGVFAEPAWPAAELALCAALVGVCAAADEGCFAYHAARGGSPTSDAAADLVEAALDREAWTVEQLWCEVTRALDTPTPSVALRVALRCYFGTVFPGQEARCAIATDYAAFLDARRAPAPSAAFWDLALAGSEGVAELTAYYGDLFQEHREAAGMWLVAGTARSRDLVVIGCDLDRPATFGRVLCLTDDHPWLSGKVHGGWPSWEGFCASAMSG